MAPESPAPTPRRALSLRLVAAAAGSRVLVLAVGFAAAALGGRRDLPVGWRFPARAEALSGWLGHLVNPWAHWDGVWYVKIATSGYAEADGSTAFFPLLPLLLRYLGLLTGGNLVVAGMALSLACFAGSVVLLHRLVAAEFDRGLADRAVLYLCLAPLSFFLQAVYTESPFLFLSLACVAAARAGRFRLAGLAALLAALTRSTGVLLLVPLAVHYWSQRGWDLRRTDRHVANLLLPLEGLLVWMAYLALAFGKPLAFSTAQAQWERFAAAPNYTVLRGAVAAAWGAVSLLSSGVLSRLWQTPQPGVSTTTAATNVFNLVFLVAAGALLWYGARRLPRAWSWYALAGLVYPLCFPSKYVPLMSYPRFTLTVFPLFVCLALLTRDRPRWHRPVVVASLVLLVVLTARFAVFAWVS